jgi:membrane glycosyltransferase
VPPNVLRRANELATAAHRVVSCPLQELRNDSDLLAAHLNSLAVTPRVRGQVDPHLAVARAKIEDAESFDEALEYLNSRETFAILNSGAILPAAIACPATTGTLSCRQLGRGRALHFGVKPAMRMGVERLQL